MRIIYEDEDEEMTRKDEDRNWLLNAVFMAKNAIEDNNDEGYSLNYEARSLKNNKVDVLVAAAKNYKEIFNKKSVKEYYSYSFENRENISSLSNDDIVLDFGYYSEKDQERFPLSLSFLSSKTLEEKNVIDTIDNSLFDYANETDSLIEKMNKGNYNVKYDKNRYKTLKEAFWKERNLPFIDPEENARRSETSYFLYDPEKDKTVFYSDVEEKETKEHGMVSIFSDKEHHTLVSLPCDNLFHFTKDGELYGFNFDNTYNIEPEQVYFVQTPFCTRKIGSSALYPCRNLTSFGLNEGLKEIGHYAFAYTNLKSLNIPHSLEKIGHNAFTRSSLYGLTGLEDSKVKVIEPFTFSHCNNLRADLLKESLKNVEEIKEKAFSGIEYKGNIALNGIENFKDNLKDALKEIAEPLPEIKFTRENYNALFPYGTIETPLGDVKLGDNQFDKLINKDRQDLLLAIKETLSDPHVVLKEKRDDGETKIYGRSFIYTNEKTKAIESVVITIDGLDVSISTHQRDINNFVNKIKDSNQLLYVATKVGALIERMCNTVTVNPTRESEYVTPHTDSIQEKDNKSTPENTDGTPDVPGKRR